MEFGRRTETKCRNAFGNEFQYHFLDRHLKDQRVLSLNISHNWILYHLWYSPALVPHSTSPCGASPLSLHRCSAIWPRSKCCASERQYSCVPTLCRYLQAEKQKNVWERLFKKGLKPIKWNYYSLFLATRNTTYCSARWYRSLHSAAADPDNWWQRVDRLVPGRELWPRRGSWHDRSWRQWHVEASQRPRHVDRR